MLPINTYYDNIYCFQLQHDSAKAVAFCQIEALLNSIFIYTEVVLSDKKIFECQNPSSLEFYQLYSLLYWTIQYTYFVNKRVWNWYREYCKRLYIIADMKVLPWHLVWGLNLHPTPHKSAPTSSLPQINALEPLKVFFVLSKPFFAEHPSLKRCQILNITVF